MNKALQIVFSILSIICLGLGMTGRIYEYNHRTNDSKSNYLKNFDKSGTKYEILNDQEYSSLDTLAANFDKEKEIKNHGVLKFNYLKSGDNLILNILIDNVTILSEPNLKIRNAYAFKEYLLLEGIKDNKVELYFVKNKKLTQTLATFKYNGMLFKIENLVSVEDSIITFTSSSYENNNIIKEDGTLHQITEFESNEIYKANFQMNYINEILLSPTIGGEKHFISELTLEQ